MLNFPKSTELNRKIPKQKFYEKADISKALRQLFVDQIEAVCWQNKLSPNTMNVEAGINVKELQVFSIELRQQHIDEKVLRCMDIAIDYHLLFLLNSDNLYRLCIGYKEKNPVNKKFAVKAYYYTSWLPLADLHLAITGYNMDAIYTGFIEQIGREQVEIKSGETLSKAVTRVLEIDALHKKITALGNKLNKEKQFNRQIEISNEIRRLKQQLEHLNHG